MAGNSPRENVAQSIFNQMQGYNPTAQNRFASMKFPFSPQESIKAVNDYTNLGESSLNKLIGRNVASAGSSAAESLGSRGYGGSILQTAVSGARENAASAGTSALEKLQQDRLKILPSIMGSANQQELQRTQGAQSADFQNIQDQFNKYRGLEGLLGAFSNTNTLGDILGVVTAISNLLPGAAKLISAI